MCHPSRPCSKVPPIVGASINQGRAWKGAADCGCSINQGRASERYRGSWVHRSRPCTCGRYCGFWVCRLTWIAHQLRAPYKGKLRPNSARNPNPFHNNGLAELPSSSCRPPRSRSGTMLVPGRNIAGEPVPQKERRIPAIGNSESIEPVARRFPASATSEMTGWFPRGNGGAVQERPKPRSQPGSAASCAGSGTRQSSGVSPPSRAACGAARAPCGRSPAAPPPR
jgi:hypothetical protein